MKTSAFPIWLRPYCQFGDFLLKCNESGHHLCRQATASGSAYLNLRWFQHLPLSIRRPFRPGAHYPNTDGYRLFLKFRWGVCVLSLNSSDNTPVWSWTQTHANVHEFPQDLHLCQLGHSDRPRIRNFLTIGKGKVLDTFLTSLPHVLCTMG